MWLQNIYTYASINLLFSIVHAYSHMHACMDNKYYTHVSLSGKKTSIYLYKLYMYIIYLYMHIDV
jgi:hypothetical protein